MSYQLVLFLVFLVNIVFAVPQLDKGEENTSNLEERGGVSCIFILGILVQGEETCLNRSTTTERPSYTPPTFPRRTSEGDPMTLAEWQQKVNYNNGNLSETNKNDNKKNNNNNNKNDNRGNKRKGQKRRNKNRKNNKRNKNNDNKNQRNKERQKIKSRENL